VQAIAAAGILMLSSYTATTAFGEDASSVPDRALKGKKMAYVACSGPEPVVQESQEFDHRCASGQGRDRDRSARSV
jgi:hypothetical protein